MTDRLRDKQDGRLPTAKWGAACSACATAKAKCIRTNPDPAAKCDRCERLLKDCTGQVHRPRKKRQSKPSRTAQIEERLNGLVDLLQATGELSDNRSTLGALSEAAAREQSSMTQDTPSASSSTSHIAHPTSWSIPEMYNSHAIPACVCSPAAGEAPPPPDPDEVLLDLFRTQLQPLYPFVIIPPSTTAAELNANKPFLMAAIRMVSSVRSLRSMRAQMYRLMTHLAEYQLIRSARCLDLLQGALVMCGWQQYHCMMHGQLTNLICMAIGLVGDLGLNSPPILREGTRLMVVKPPEPTRRTNEERRALLGVWFIACNVSISFQRIEPMRYTAYVQECLRDLEQEMEYVTDGTLCFLVRIQRLTERIFELKEKPVDELPKIPTAPMSAQVAAFQGEIDRLRESMPAYMQNDSCFQAYIHTAMLRLYEPPAVDVALVKSLTASLTTTSSDGFTPLDRLYQSSSALRNWFDNWLITPASDYYRHPTTVMSQIVYALTMLGRWAQLATPRTVYSSGTPMPSGNSTSSLRKADVAAPGMAAASRSSQGYNQSDNKGRCPSENQPGLVEAVAELQLQLQSQPSLSINIPEILSRMCTRCEEVNAIFQDSLPEKERLIHNVWSFSALKVRITRVKLERWAEQVAAVAQGPEKKSEDWRGSYPQTPNVMPGNLDGFANDQTQIQNYLDNTPWTTDFLDGIDPTVWFDGYLDWGNLAMNAMPAPVPVPVAMQM